MGSVHLYFTLPMPEGFQHWDLRLLRGENVSGSGMLQDQKEMEVTFRLVRTSLLFYIHAVVHAMCLLQTICVLLPFFKTYHIIRRLFCVLSALMLQLGI